MYSAGDLASSLPQLVHCLHRHLWLKRAAGSATPQSGPPVIPVVSCSNGDVTYIASSPDSDVDNEWHQQTPAPECTPDVAAICGSLSAADVPAWPCTSDPRAGSQQCGQASHGSPPGDWARQAAPHERSPHLCRPLADLASAAALAAALESPTANLAQTAADPASAAAAAGATGDGCAEPEGLDALLAAMQRGPASLQSLAAAALAPPSLDGTRSPSPAADCSSGKRTRPRPRSPACRSSEEQRHRRRHDRQTGAPGVPPFDLSPLQVGSPQESPAEGQPSLSPASSLSLAIDRHIATAAALAEAYPEMAAASDCNGCTCCCGSSGDLNAGCHRRRPAAAKHAAARSHSRARRSLSSSSGSRSSSRGSRISSSSSIGSGGSGVRGGADSGSDCSICTATSRGVSSSRHRLSHLLPAAWAAEFSPRRRQPPARSTIDTAAGPEGPSGSVDGCQRNNHPSVPVRRARTGAAGAKRRCIASTPTGDSACSENRMPVLVTGRCKSD